MGQGPYSPVAEVGSPTQCYTNQALASTPSGTQGSQNLKPLVSSPLLAHLSEPCVYIYTMEYYSAIKKNKFESVLMRWMKLEIGRAHV